MKKLRISFDIGGVLSKYPDILRPVFNALCLSSEIEVYVLTDMPSPEQSFKMLRDNGFYVKPENLINSNFTKYGEMCKSIDCKNYEIDVHIDDFPGYVAEGAKLRLLVMPDLKEPYYADSWKTDGSEGDFGRRKRGV